MFTATKRIRANLVNSNQVLCITASLFPRNIFIRNHKPEVSMDIRGNSLPESKEILTPEALAFLEQLEHEFGQHRRELLRKRAERQNLFDAGTLPDFLHETSKIRSANWKVGSIPADLQNRRVEITGPTDRKMMINALNSGANIFMADFEDANSPTWENLIQGHINLCDAIEHTLTLTTPEKNYQ